MAIVALVLYIAFFAPGMGPMPWTINAEICAVLCMCGLGVHRMADPPKYRGFGNSVATAVNARDLRPVRVDSCAQWTGNLLISMTFLDLGNAITEAGAFWLYAGFALAGFVFVYAFVPETKGLVRARHRRAASPAADTGADRAPAGSAHEGGGGDAAQQLTDGWLFKSGAQSGKRTCSAAVFSPVLRCPRAAPRPESMLMSARSFRGNICTTSAPHRSRRARCSHPPR